MENLTAHESLEIITSAIQKTKENIKEQSFFYLFWGWLTVSAALTQYALISFTAFQTNYLPWVILMPIGVIVSVIYGKKHGKQRGYETYLDMFLKYLWIVISFSFFLIVFISIVLQVNTTIFILFLAGVGTLVSGMAMKFKPLIAGGILFFAFTIVSLYVSAQTGLLILSLAILTGYLIPAYLLKKS